jgi:hypothetical protein
MAIDYYSKYLKYKAKYLELKKQLGGNDDEPVNKEKKPEKQLILCHKLSRDDCTGTPGCVNKYGKKGEYMGCKQKYCWNRSKDFCKNAGLQAKSGSFFGTSGCEYDETQGCRMKCGHIENEGDCGNLNECRWDGSTCAARPNPCKVTDINKCKENDKDCKWQSGYGFAKSYCTNK